MSHLAAVRFINDDTHSWQEKAFYPYEEPGISGEELIWRWVYIHKRLGWGPVQDQHEPFDDRDLRVSMSWTDQVDDPLSVRPDGSQVNAIEAEGGGVPSLRRIASDRIHSVSGVLFARKRATLIHEFRRSQQAVRTLVERRDKRVKASRKALRRIVASYVGVWEAFRAALGLAIPELLTGGVDLTNRSWQHSVRGLIRLQIWLLKSYLARGEASVAKVLKAWALDFRHQGFSSEEMEGGISHRPALGTGSGIPHWNQFFVGEIGRRIKTDPLVAIQLSFVGRALPLGNALVAKEALEKHREIFMTPAEPDEASIRDLERVIERRVRPYARLVDESEPGVYLSASACFEFSRCDGGLVTAVHEATVQRMDEPIPLSEIHEADGSDLTGVRRRLNFPRVPDKVRIPQHSLTGGQNAAVYLNRPVPVIPPRSVVEYVVDISTAPPQREFQRLCEFTLDAAKRL